MELKQGFKQTEVGVIPEDWQVKTMAETGENIIGLTYSPKDVKEYGHLVLRSSNIQNNKLAFENNVFVEMELPKRVIVKENDILICVRNGSKQLIGKCALIDKATEGSAFGAFMSVYRTTSAKYIFHQFQSNVIQRQIDEVMGATINQLTNKNLASFEIPFPKEEAEQNAIATALSDIDELISQTEKLIDKKKAIKQGVMQELLKPKEGWQKKKMSSIFKIFKGKGLSKSKLSESGTQSCLLYGELFTKYQEEITDVFSKTNYNEGMLSEAGDILFPGSTTTTGADLAKASTISIPGVQLGGDIIILRKVFNEVDPLFITYFLNIFRKNEISKMTKGITIHHLYGKDLYDIQIEYPSMKEQSRISGMLKVFESELNSLEKYHLKLKLQKQGMMQALLTGKIRLI